MPVDCIEYFFAYRYTGQHIRNAFNLKLSGLSFRTLPQSQTLHWLIKFFLGTVQGLIIGYQAGFKFLHWSTFDD